MQENQPPLADSNTRIGDNDVIPSGIRGTADPFLSSADSQGAMNSLEVTMGETSPPRMAGNKSAAASSPAITPPGQGIARSLAPNNSAVEECETELKPSRLSDKFGAPPKKKTSSSIAPSGSTNSNELIDWMDPLKFAELVSDPSPPTTGEVLPYEFDDEDEYTKTNIYKLNGLKLEECMRRKVDKCKQQDRSQAHPKWGPFRLQATQNPSEMEIINHKGKKALYFKVEELSLGAGDLIFDSNDLPTYTLLCYAGPKTIMLQIAIARRRRKIKNTDNGPF